MNILNITRLITIALLTRSRGALGFKFKHYDMRFNNLLYNEGGVEGSWYSYTILTILKTILLEDLGSEGEDNLSNGGSSSRRGRWIFHGNR